MTKEIKPQQKGIPFVTGEGVHFLRARSKKEAHRIDLIVSVDIAVTSHDKPALRKLKRQCADIPLLSSKIEAALKG